MHNPTDRIAHTTAFATPVVEHWLEREIAQWAAIGCQTNGIYTKCVELSEYTDSAHNEVEDLSTYLINRFYIILKTLSTEMPFSWRRLSATIKCINNKK